MSHIHCSWRVSLCVLALLAAGCLPPKDGVPSTTPSTSTTTPSGPCTGAGTGTLQIGDAPFEADWRLPPAVTVFGPDGDEIASVIPPGTVSDLPGGTYTIEAHRGVADAEGQLAGEAWTASEPIVQVCVGDGRITEIAFDRIEQPGRLWVSSGETLAAFDGAQVEAGGTATPALRIDTTLVNDFRGFAFDRMGHLWAAASPTYGTRLLWWTPGAVEAGEPATAELHSPVFEDFAAISDLVFDPAGTLWVALHASDGSFDGVVGFSRATLAGALLAGTTTEAEPDVVRPIDGLIARIDLELDPDGALWVADFDSDRLLRIDDPTDGRTGADGAFTVFAAPTTPDGSPALLEGAENIAFDSAGDAVALMWTSGALFPLDGSELSASGAHDLVVGTDLLYVDQLPTGLVIDGADRSWLGNYAGDGTGQILSWAPGLAPEPWLVSEAIPDPADLVLDPRPR